jgi:hypothetical protein
MTSPAAATESQSTNWAARLRYTLFKTFQLGGDMRQVYNNPSDKWTSAPMVANAFMQEQLTRHWAVTVTLTVFNLLDKSMTQNQTVTPTSTTEWFPFMTGRFFLLGVKWRLEKFSK